MNCQTLVLSFGFSREWFIYLHQTCLLFKVGCVNHPGGRCACPLDFEPSNYKPPSSHHLTKYYFLKSVTEYYIYSLESEEKKVCFSFWKLKKLFPASSYILFHLLKGDGGLGFKCFVNLPRRHLLPTVFFMFKMVLRLFF